MARSLPIVLDMEPEVPNEKLGSPEMTMCGEDELVKTFLTAQQVPAGKEVL